MELKRTWDNVQAIFHALTDVKDNKNVKVIYEEFEDHCSSVFWCNKRKLISKDEADDPEEDYVTLYLKIIQRATIV